MKGLKEFKPLLKFIKEEKKKIIIASILIFICGLTEIFTGYLNGAAIESITNLDVLKSILYLIIYLLISITFGGCIRIYAGVMLDKIENTLSRKIGYFTYKKALDLPSYAYEKKSSGEIINRITNDSNTLSSSFEQLINTVSSLIGSFVIIIYIFLNSWIVGLEILFFIFILYFILKKYNPMLKKIHEEEREKEDKFTSLVNESIRGVREIKTLGIKNNLLSNMSIIIKDLFNKNNEEINVGKKFNNLTRFLKAFLEVIVFITCVILLYYDKTTLTFFIAMTYYVYRYMWLIENINSLTQIYQRVIVSLGRVNEILDNKLFEDEEFGNQTISNIKGIIEFKNVSFSYPDEGEILNKFNLKIEPNQKVAIVGKSGQGKTTLFNLITRLFNPTEGEILLDGINIENLTEEELRKDISIIRQDPFIFNRTIKENFKLIDKNISLKEIRQYASLSYLDEYIMSLPNKYDTLLGEGGVNLSGGQKQRLSIARTLAKKSKVILFDEATSALDNNSQNYIKKSIDNLIENHTVIIVAHRLSTIIDADIIYVVDNGRIVASGNHSDLLQKSKIYRNLYETESFE